MITNMTKYKKILEENGLKPTYQRIKVMEYLDKHIDTHPTAEVIFEAIVDKIPTMSLTTVYNTLDALVKKKIVCEITITGTETRYDIIASPHHHFLCKKCGHIYDINITCPQAGRHSIDNHRIDETHGYFKGVCRDCLSKSTKR